MTFRGYINAELDSTLKFRVNNDLLERASNRASNEGTNLSELIRQWLSDYAADYNDDRPIVDHRTLRRQAVQRLTRQGWSLSQIADHLGVTTRTVRRDRAE